MSRITPEQVKTKFNNGDWTHDPWFLAPQHETLFERANLPRSKILSAVDGLARVYPPEVCRELLVAPHHAWLIHILFQPCILAGIVPRLRLGHDVATLGRSVDDGTLKRLHNRSHYDAVAFELAVWANLKRNLYVLEREPRGPGKSNPDFALCFDHRRYILELKDLDLAEQEFFASEVNDLMQQVVSNLWHAHRLFKIRSSPEFQKRCGSPEGRKALASQLPEMVVAFAKKAAEVEQLGFQIGQYPVDSYGMIDVKEDMELEQGALEWDLVPPLTARKRVMRSISVIKKAVGQLPASGLGVGLINVGRFRKIELLREELMIAQRERPLKFQNCAFVVVRTLARSEKGIEKPFLDVIPMSHHRMSRAEMDFVKVLEAPNSGEEPQMPPSSRLVHLGRIQGPAQAGSSIQFTLTGPGRIIRP
ncbi:hypothetical protein POL68_20130 [Stigmatella sp. ncwal1]|uniref:Uncharacterized protein n=1 Tax=Stigmatella ashevillensis TaxID=2995309 RepID=A0ABT5DCF9_9BACT|nr:hypothetical protein [Stigmatella ashevillena]MDC0710795.1 hypothetical protein [Stigmatella ashevillena]